MREAYEKLKAVGVHVPAWPDMDSIQSVRMFGSWFYTYQNAVELREFQPLLLIVLNGCSARLAQLKEERAARIARDRSKYNDKASPFQPRQGDGKSPE